MRNYFKEGKVLYNQKVIPAQPKKMIIQQNFGIHWSHGILFYKLYWNKLNKMGTACFN